MIFRNSIAQSVALFAGYVFSFILAPVMLARLGLAQFGVWAVTGAITTYAALADLGVTRALGRFVAVYDARRDRRSIEMCFTLGLLLVAALTVPAAAAAAVAAPFVASAVDHVLNASDMRIVLLCSVAILSLHLLGYVANAVPEGMQQFVPPKIASVVGSAVNFAFSLTALALSPDLVVYAMANVAAEIITCILALIAMHHVWRPVRLAFPSRALTKEVLGFSLKTQVSWIAELINSQTDKIILALVVSVRAAASFEIANRVVQAVRSIALLSQSALGPTAASQIVLGGRSVIAEFYRTYTRRTLSISLPVMVLACVTAPASLIAWLGEPPPNSLALFVALTLANCVNITTGVGFALSIGEGKAGLVAGVSVASAVINIIATLILTPLLGLWGVVGGTIISVIGGALVYLVMFHRDHGIPWMDYVRAVGTPALIAGMAALPVLATALLLGTPTGGRLPAVVMTVALAGGYLGIYWPLADRRDLLPEALRLASLSRRLRRRTPEADPV